MSLNLPGSGYVDETAPKGNGHLPTPALSAVSDDEDGIQPFPGITDQITGLNKEIPQTRHDDSNRRRRRTSSSSKPLKLNSRQLHDLTTSPDSIPLRRVEDDLSPSTNEAAVDGLGSTSAKTLEPERKDQNRVGHPELNNNVPSVASVPLTPGEAVRSGATASSSSSSSREPRRTPVVCNQTKPGSHLPPLQTEETSDERPNGALHSPFEPSAVPSELPIPPLSLPTYLQLELSSNKPSTLYIHRASNEEFPYESSKVKFDRLVNFLLLPPSLEEVLWFGALACLDAWLYTFTVLPLRFLKAIWILVQWFGRNFAQEFLDLCTFVYRGLGRVWQRRSLNSVPDSRRSSQSDAPPPEGSSNKAGVDAKSKSNGSTKPLSPVTRPAKPYGKFRHVRRRSTPSALRPSHKADILQGLLILASCTVLMRFDASRVYHSIRGQSTIKLYVLYNTLEVFDRLFAAFGQDVLECLFSKETLERDSNGRSKIFRPLWMFALALIYNVIHATTLFYQIITLNVAVNSYSNALLTLLMSNQFVEIKGSVFKKFEKEDLFQLTCADIVERFQLWLMLIVIALRNIVELGGLSISLNSALGAGSAAASSASSNSTGVPLITGFSIPQALKLLPKWTGEVLGPFMIVLGSEALVDWCKHAYINKFNNVKPNIYGRFLDVLAKDYYSHAFADQNLTKRLGLPVIPLSCLFIRACIQTYHMFLATHMPLPIPSAATSISVDSETATTSPGTMAALQHIDHVFRRALGRSSFGAGTQSTPALSWWSLDDFIALATMIVFFLAIYLVLLALKLVLGMVLLSYARRRYQGMKEREREGLDSKGRFIGGRGMVEVSEDKRRWIYNDDPNGLAKIRERDERGRSRTEMKLDNVQRYSMVAKRIW